MRHVVVVALGLGFLKAMPLLGVLATASSAPGPAVESRVVIEPDAPCRTQPDTLAAVAFRYHVGDVFVPADHRTVGGDLWHLDTARRGGGSPGCWVRDALTADWSDREAALTAAADRILSRTDDVTFEAFVAVDNFIVQTRSRSVPGARVIERSPILQLRRLQIVERAVDQPEAWPERARGDPLTSAWIFANRDVLTYHQPAGSWIVEADTYWRLFERHRDTVWAEEIAWAAAQGALVRDECDGACVLNSLLRTVARYWEAFPDGERMHEAMEHAERQAGLGARVGCLVSIPEDAVRFAEQLRATLEHVRSPGRKGLLRQVAAIEDACAAGSARVPLLGPG